MANILVISGSYYPYATANAACMKEFEKKLIAEGHTVTYAIRQHDIDTGEHTKQGDVEIYHIPRSVDNFYSTCEKLKKQPLPQPLKGMFRFGLLLIKAVMRVYTKLFFGLQRNYAEQNYLKEYSERIADIVDQKHIDVIISVSMPFLSHKAVMCYLDRPDAKRVKWVAYMIDAYSRKYATDDKKAKECEELEVMRRADRILMLSVLEKDYSDEAFRGYTNKMQFLPLPLLNLDEKEECIEGIDTASGITDCIFAGVLYDDTSSLEFFKKFLLKARLQDKIRFHIMGKRYAKNQEILEELIEAGYDITLYGRMPSRFAEESVRRADLVLNIGNLSTNQITSKVLQCIRLGKPIMTFYRIPDDPALPYLEKYPLALNIYEQDDSLKDEAILRATEFIVSAAGLTADRQEIKKLFAEDASDVVCDRFMDFMADML